MSAELASAVDQYVARLRQRYAAIPPGLPAAIAAALGDIHQRTRAFPAGECDQAVESLALQHVYPERFVGFTEVTTDGPATRTEFRVHFVAENWERACALMAEIPDESRHRLCVEWQDHTGEPP